MEHTFKAWKTDRQLYLPFFENYTLAQLNYIPPGFSNNLIWNMGHVIVTQQKLVYKGSGLAGYIPDDLFGKYQSGTKPTELVVQSEADELKHLLIWLTEQTETDFQNGMFTTYHARTTGTGFHVASVEDALVCNNYHEGIHLGYMMSIRKFSRQQF